MSAELTKGSRPVVLELVLIVAGILIALALNGWSENRHNRRVELQVLREMHHALAVDIADNRSDFESFRMERALIDSLRVSLDEGRPYTPAQDSLFGAMLTTRVLQVNAGPYDVMRARGFDLLTDDVLRSHIVHYYGTTVPFMTSRYARVDSFVDSYAAPYYFKHFRGGTRGGDPASPVSFAFIRSDPEFHNLINWQLKYLGTMLSSYETTLREGDALVSALARHISELER